MPSTKPTLGAFNQGGVPTIACFNKAVTPLGVDFDALIQAMQAYVDKHVASVWGTPAKLIKSTGFVKDAWAMVFLDDADAPGALAYHDLTPAGLPLSKVFVRTTLQWRPGQCFGVARTRRDASRSRDQHDDHRSRPKGHVCLRERGPRWKH